ncbi:MAG TPA: hypothetical protein VFF73_06555 [Planctomycetota bacterium]|nr:hypothetical protein [Planctomycetota bacterium]
MRLGVVLLVLLAAGVARAQQPTPVPRELLQGNKLVLADANCSAEAPDEDGWEWCVGATNATPDFTERDFVCRKPGPGDVFLLGVYSFTKTPSDRITLEGATRLAKNIAKGSEKSGFTSSNLVCQPASSPRAGQSFSFSFALAGKKGQGASMSGFITDLLDDTYRVYMLGRVSQDPAESPAFTKFVNSFKVLKEPPPRLPRTMTPELLGLGYFVWLGMCLLVGGLVNAGARRPVVNGANIAVVIIVIFMVLNVGALIMRAGVGPQNVSSDKLAQLAGEHVGAALLPLILGAYLGQRFKKSQQPS